MPTAVTCVRCGSLMDPPPPPPPPPLPRAGARAGRHHGQTEPCVHPPTWLVVLCTSIVSVGLTLMIVWMV